MDDYEPMIVEITTHSDSHRLFLVRDYRGRQWQARGLRRMDEKEWVISRERSRRESVIYRYQCRCRRLYDNHASQRKRKKIETRMREVCEQKREKNRERDWDAWYLENFHKHRNHAIDLPPVPSWEEISKPD